MLLSQAMRNGAKLHRKGNGDYTVVVNGELCTCAFGAAGEGMLVGTEYTHQQIWDKASWLYDDYENVDVSACPKCGINHRGLSNTITELSDIHNWTREAIANWLEGLGY